MLIANILDFLDSNYNCPFCPWSTPRVERINNSYHYGRIYCNHCGHFIAYLDYSEFHHNWQNKNAFRGCGKARKFVIDSS